MYEICIYVYIYICIEYTYRYQNNCLYISSILYTCRYTYIYIRTCSITSAAVATIASGEQSGIRESNPSRASSSSHQPPAKRESTFRQTGESRIGPKRGFG